jgi:LuxR family maltose regulon positive regulatory protein
MSIRSDALPRAELRAQRVQQPTRTVRVGLPAAHTEMVERRHLVDVLRRGARGPVTLLSAPAGFGKTVLVGAWTSLIDPSVPVAHVTLHEDDQSPAVFWVAVLEAFRMAGVDVSGVPAPAASEGIDRPMLAGLIGSINAHGGPVVWVLDCGELSLAPNLGDGLHRVVEECQESLHLVLLTRADPPLPLHRYRLAGTITEIRAADLLFTASEASTLLQHAGLDLAPLDAVMLRSRTGGWPAGLQFAAMTLAGRVDIDQAIREFRGDAGNVAAFLTTEVYEKQPPRIREFLLRTCLVDELSPGLASALTGQSDASGVLQFIARGNAFVEPVPGRSGWYRYQSLFREFLRSQLTFEHPELTPALHRAAATQLAAEGHVLASLQHAVAAEDWSLATHLLVDGLWVGGLLVGGHRAGFHDLFSGLPRDAEGAPSAVTRAALALVERDNRQCEAELAQARRLLDRQPDVSQSCELAVSVLDAVSASLHDGVTAALDRVLAAEAALRGAAPDVRERHPDLVAILARSKATVLVRRGELGAALESLVEGVAAASAPHLGDALEDLQGMAALVHALSGDLRQAEKIVTRLAPMGIEPGGGSAGVPRTALAALAWVRLDEYDLQDAHALVRSAERQASTYDAMLADEVLTLVQARLFAAEGGIELARHTLRAFPHSAREGVASGWLAREHVLGEARLLIAQGLPEEAAAVARTIPGDQQLERDVILQRALLDERRGETALAEPTARMLHRQPLAVQVETWLTLAEQSVRAGDGVRAEDCVERALSLAAPERLRRPFLEARSDVRALLEKRSLVPRARWLHPHADSHVEHPQRSGHGHEHPPPVTVDTARPERLVNPLTKKELEVLGHLAELLTTEEIADTMFVSVNTVRSHVRNILRKLGVARRNEAVRRAWELQLLPPPNVA